MVDNVPANYFPLHLFFERLSRAGIAVSIRDYRRISRVLATDGDWTLQRLERVLGNLLVRDRDERLLFQHEFRGFFAATEEESVVVDVQRWREELARLLAEGGASLPLAEETPSNSPLSGGEQEEVTPASSSSSSPDKGRLGGVSWRWLSAAILLIILSVIVWKYYPRDGDTPQTPPQPEKPSVTETDTLNGKPPISDMITVQVTQAPEPEVPKRIPLAVWLSGAGLAALLAAGLLGVWWTQYRPPNIRQKIPCDPSLPAQYFDDASVGGAIPPWLAEADADHLTDQLSYILTDQYTRELDIPASIRATSASGSVPVLRFQKRRDLQRILILTDQLVPQQGWHQLPAELMQALQARGVHLTFGRFNYSPERFIDQHGRAQRLEDWEEYRHHLLLLIFADTHQVEGLQEFPWRDWPDARLLTRQERRDWDFREQNLQAQGVRLLQADAAGIQQAWGEAVQRPAALEAGRWEVEGQKPDESDEAYLERALGAALPWAQALAYYPGAWSLAAAEHLRETLFVDVPRLALQRLLGLPGTWVAAGVVVFESRLQVVLREGFLRRTRAEHEAAVGVWLGIMAEETPSNSPLSGGEQEVGSLSGSSPDKGRLGGVSSSVSLAWVIWRWKCIRLAWVLDPDQAAKDLHALVVSVPVLGEAIREEVAQLPGDAVSAALLVPVTRTGRRHLLALGEVCGLKQAVVYAAAPWLRNAGVVSVLAVGVLGIGAWNQREILPDPPFAKGGEREVPVPHLVTILGGTFEMGCVENKDCANSEKPVHSVTVSDFEMGAYEVTVGQFRAFVAATGYQTTAETDGSCFSYGPDSKSADVKGNSWQKTGYTQTEDSPVTCVSWQDAQAYLKWLSEQTKQAWRLPSEAEWEYATRAGTKMAYSWGDQPPVCDTQAANGAQFTDCKENAPVNVGSFKPNPFGLYDVHGNAWEWVEDCYSSDYKDAAIDGSARQGCDANASRVLRGGSWFYFPQALRSASRDNNSPDFRNNDVGFRAARTINPLPFTEVGTQDQSINNHYYDYSGATGGSITDNTRAGNTSTYYDYGSTGTTSGTTATTSLTGITGTYKGVGTYVVQPGDTVFQVMRNTGAYWKDIIRLNDLQAPDYTIKPGQTLRMK